MPNRKGVGKEFPGAYFNYPRALCGHGLVLHDTDELARLKTSAPFSSAPASPLRCILAGGLTAIVAIGEVEETPIHTDSDECAVGLKGDAVLTNELELVGDIPATARGCEILYVANCAKLTGSEGESDCLFHNVLIFNVLVVNVFGKGNVKEREKEEEENHRAFF